MNWWKKTIEAIGLSRPNKCTQRHTSYMNAESLESRTLLTGNPVITSLNVVYISENYVELYGTIDDENPETVSIEFSGAVSACIGVYSDGTFTGIFAAEGLGNVTAIATDEDELISSPVVQTLESDVPVISSFYAVEMSENVYRFSGHVADESPAGLVIQFGGLLAYESCVVNSDGTFEFEYEFPPQTTGTVSVTTTDWWGQDSNSPSTTV